jgi:hypothetical protein
VSLNKQNDTKMKKLIIGIVLLAALVSSCKNLHYINYGKPFDFLKLNNDRFIVKDKSKIKTAEIANTSTIEETIIQPDSIDFISENVILSNDSLIDDSISTVENIVISESQDSKDLYISKQENKKTSEISSVKKAVNLNNIQIKPIVKRSSNISSITYSKSRGRFYDLFISDGLLWLILIGLAIVGVLLLAIFYSHIAWIYTMVTIIIATTGILAIGATIFFMGWLITLPFRMLFAN